MSFASEFRKKYFLDPLNVVVDDPGPEAGLSLRRDGASDDAPGGDKAEAQPGEDIETDGDAAKPSPDEHESGPALDALRDSNSQEADTEPDPAEHDPERLYQHEVIAPPPNVEPSETRANFRRVLVAMLIAAGLLAVLNSGALATYARGLPYGKVYERMIMGAEVWHGYMEQIGVTAIITTARDWVTAVRESRWADTTGLEDGPDLSSEMPAPDAIDGIEPAQAEGGVLPGPDSPSSAGSDETGR